MNRPKYAEPLRRLHLLGLSLLVVSCVTSRDVMAPDGSLAHYIECPRNQSLCMDVAATLCPSGYDMIGSGGQHGAFVQANAQTGTAIVTPTYRGNMTVKCRRPTPAASPIARALPDASGCVMAHGPYLVNQTEREGNCGRLNEVIVNWTGDKWQVPPGCQGNVDASPDGCRIVTSYKCPPDDKGITSERVQVDLWNADSSHGTTRMQWRLVFADGHSCASTYDGTFTKQ